MSVTVKSVAEGSVCEKKGIKNGFKLDYINEHPVTDVLDYRFFADVRVLNMSFTDNNGDIVRIRVKNTGDIDSLGLEFDTYLMDKQHCCKNKCIFCFIDQLPKGMRESLYFKDDDSRLSFLFGNYVTLTNMTDYEVSRIIDMHISPVNISVHTMNPELRVKMMKNPDAGKSLDILKRFAENGISINAQLVLCPGINDGKELEYSLSQLYKYKDSVLSVAAVPVGLTDYRQGLCELDMYNKETASEVIDIIDNFNRNTQDGKNFVYAADEFYLKAEKEIPPYEYYGDFEQLDNGVGKWASTLYDFERSLENCDTVPDGKRNVALITGVAAYPLINGFAEKINAKFTNVKVRTYKVVNDFFGHNITVAGLVTAGDIIKQTGDLSESDFAVIPSVMLKSRREPVFLDDITVCELEDRLNVKIKVSDDDSELLNMILE